MGKRILLIFMAALVLALAAAFYVLAYTQTGLRLAVAQIERLERMGIRAAGITGRLTGPLRIERFELDNERVHVIVEDIEIDLHLRWLALNTIDVYSLTAGSAAVMLKPGGEIAEAAPRESRFLPDFLRVTIDRAEVGALSVTPADGEPITAERFTALVRIRPRSLTVEDFALAGPRFAVQGDLELGAARPMKIEFTGAAQLPIPQRPTLDLTANVAGDLEALNVTAQLRAPSIAAVRARVTGSANRPWRVAGNLTTEQFALAPWIPESDLELTGITLAFDAQPTLIEVTGHLTVPKYDTGELEILARGTYEDQTLILSTARIAGTQAPLRLEGGGRIAFGGAEPAVNLAAEWTQAQWPLRGADPLIASPRGRLTLSGPLPYRYSITADVEGAKVPAMRALANGALDRERLVIERYQIDALDGTATGRGTLSLNDRSWTLNVTGTDLDPAPLHASFPGRLTFAADARGSSLSPNADFTLVLHRLTGELRNQRVSASAIASRDSTGWRVDDGRAQLGAANATLDGTIAGTTDSRLDVRWSLDAPNLTQILPGASGQLRFAGQARGPRMQPEITATVDGSALEYGTSTAATLRAEGHVDLSGNTESRLEIEAGGLSVGPLTVQTLTVNGSGNNQAHTLRVAGDTRTDDGVATRAEIELRGAYTDETWTGRVEVAQLVEADGDRLVRLTEPASLNARRDAVNLEQLCLLVIDSTVCGTGTWERSMGWQASVEGNALSLESLSTLIPGEARYRGRLDVEVAASGLPGEPVVGRASLLLDDAELIYQPLQGESEMVQIGSGRADLVATTETYAATIGLATNSSTFIAAAMNLTRIPQRPFGQLPLNGRIRARMGDANLLPLLIPEIDHAAGVLTAEVGLSGQLHAPQLDGRIELNRGELDLYRVNLSLRELELGATLAGNRISFDGRGRAGEGTLESSGILMWRNSLPSGTLRLQGSNLLVADLPDYRVVAAPDLTFRINGRDIAATGEVVIPSARIQPTDLSGAVQVSPDSRLITDDPDLASSGFRVTSDITIRLGEDVQLDTFGLQGRLAGSVGTLIRPGEIPQGRGELSVAQGRYEAYGQELDITRGRLLFDASPLDDPGLDIQAERKIETITVGLNVRGTLREPRFGFYSEPSMSQTQIMSYLLVGKPLDELQSGDAAQVGSASSALALQGGGLIASQIGRRLGIEEIGVESTANNDTALVLGKFLSPRLFVSYGISLTESINTLKLRYTITDRWVLKTEAGEHQSADMEFTIERP